MADREAQLADLLGKLLGCCELSLGDQRMCRYTREVVREASAFLADSKHEGSEKPTYAEVPWTAGDVRTLCKLSEGEAEEWLAKNEKHLRDRITELGWDVMRDLLEFDGIDTKHGGADDEEPDQGDNLGDETGDPYPTDEEYFNP